MNNLTRVLRQFGIKRGDLILAAALLILSAASAVIIAFLQPPPEYVSVRENGLEICRLPLDRDCRYSIGSGNIIEISGGSVRMIYADCPNKICVRTGAISRGGQSIVCAPHRVTVTVTGGKNDQSYDAITN